MQVQTAQQLWTMYLQLPKQERTAFLAKVQTAEEKPAEPIQKVPIYTLRKKRDLRTAEEIDAEIEALRNEWDRGF